MSDHRRTVEQFLNGIAHADAFQVEQAIRTYAADDLEWTQPRHPPCHSSQEAIELMRRLRAESEYGSGVIDTRHVVADGGVVISERVDRLLRKDGTPWRDVPSCSVFEMDGDGRISVWREYVAAV